MNYPLSGLYYYNSRQPRFNPWLFIAGVLALLLIILLLTAYAQPIIPENLWQGIVAEDCSGDYQTYLVIASVVRNRLLQGMDNGLVALKRKNLGQFVRQEYAYSLKTKGLDLTKLAAKAIEEVFIGGKDYADGATNYEHTKIYGIPKYTQKMKLVKIIYVNTKKEIMLWKP